MNFKNQIENLFQEKIELSVLEIVSNLNISKQYAHKILILLVENDFVEKIGSTPKTIYKLKNIYENKNKASILIPREKQTFLNENFILITEIG